MIEGIVDIDNVLIYEIRYKQRFSFRQYDYFTIIIKSYSDEIISVARNLFNDEDILGASKG